MIQHHHDACEWHVREIGLVLLLGIFVTALVWSVVQFSEARADCVRSGGRLVKGGQNGWQNYRCVK